MRVGFANRIEAARQLSGLVSSYPSQETVILTPMNGSIVIGKVISQQTGIPMDLLAALPLHHPVDWEKCVGAVSPDDHVLSTVFTGHGHYIHETVPRVRRRLDAQLAFFRKGRHPLSLKGKTLVIIAEGVRTGLKLLPSVALLAKALPARIVVAAPVVAPEAGMALLGVAQEVRNLYMPMPFVQIGDFYRSFPFHGEDDLARIFCGAEK
jgi:putative phosphoribosyl transferase